MTTQITVWRGIRFARLAHPFAAPELVASSSPPDPGGEYGSAPLQVDAPWIELGAPTSTDCLFLNIWAPEGARDLPVALYFYGGGFEAGAASADPFDGAELARSAHCLVVTANYRVGAFGFADFSHLGGALADAHNLGLQDARAALQWTAAHVAAFGGDANAITIIGQSAGGFIAAALAVAPSIPPVRAAICISGGSSRIIAQGDSAALADNILVELRLSDTPNALVDADPGEILAAQTRVAPRSLSVRNGVRPQGFGVARDDGSLDAVVPRHPLDAFADGAATGTFIVAAAAVDEADGFPGVILDTPTSSLADGVRALVGEVDDSVVEAYESVDTDAAWRRVLGDYVYRLPAARLVQAQRGAGGRAAYLEISRADGLPAAHGVDTPGVFGHVSNQRDAALHAVVAEVIRTGAIAGGAVADPVIAGDVHPTDVHSPAELLSIWKGVARP